VFVADEYYLLAGRPFPAAEIYGDFPMHEDGIGMARTLEAEFLDPTAEPTGTQAGFFAWVDGAPAEGYRAPRADSPALAVSTGEAVPAPVVLTPRRGAPVGVLTGTLGAPIIEPLVAQVGRDDVRVIPVPNHYFGGNIGVTGLMVGEDLARVLAEEPEGHRYVLPDVCLSRGVFLDGTRPEDLPRPVEVIPTDGAALRRALEAAR
jgi:NifB/MoaA-like Fe-S oxidoreductase